MLGILLNEWDVGCIVKWVDKINKVVFLECSVCVYIYF